MRLLWVFFFLPHIYNVCHIQGITSPRGYEPGQVAGMESRPVVPSDGRPL